MEHPLTKHYESLVECGSISVISKEQLKIIDTIFKLFDEFIEKYKILTISIKDISLYEVLGIIVLCHNYNTTISSYLCLIEDQNIFNSIKLLTTEIILEDIELLYKIFSDIDINSRTIIKNN